VKRLLPVGVGLLALGAIVGVLNLPLGLLIGVAGIAVIAYGAMKRDGPPASDSAGDEFNPKYRVYLAPLRKLHADIEALVEEHKDSTTIRVIGTEALEESGAVLQQAVKLVVSAEDIRHAMQGKTAAESDILDLQNRVLTAASDEERDTLQRSIDARKLEVERYSALDRRLSEIQAHLRQAEAALAEVKSRLVLVASSPEPVEGDDQELRDRLGRLHALSDSLGESDALLQEKNR